MGCGAQSSNDVPSEELARIHCGGCHAFPEPDLLPKAMWENVLPAMGARLGMPSEDYDPYADKSMEVKFKLDAARIYPSSPMLSKKHWKQIQAYILEEAPDQLELPQSQPWESASLFEAHFPDLPMAQPAAISMVDFDPATQALYLADRNGNFGRLNPEYSFDYKIRLPRPIVEIERSKQGLLRMLSIGQLYPDEGSSGVLVEMQESQPGRQGLLFEGLTRPVHFVSTDVDHDEQEDFIVCAFGNAIGRFSWFERSGRTFSETVIKDVSGASKVHAEDLDGNGYEDLVVLFAQGDEGVSIFYNEEGTFREDKILRFHPLYGSNDFEFLDFDGDGDKDLILTNGDNGDYSNVLKPYHGVRIFLNDGNQEFTEQFFFPHFGAAKVRCRDFDLDGDLDLFVMSFFPDFDQAGRNSLLYLENQGNWHFIPQRIEGADAGRWMVMDAGDVDQDGDEDVVLGSFVLNSTGIDPVLIKKWESSNKKVLILENQQIP